MTEPYLIDSDVVLKVAAYQLNAAVIDILTISDLPPAMLVVGSYAVRKKVSKLKLFHDQKVVIASVSDFIDKLSLIEPSVEEIELAAELEETGIKAGVSLDTGEAQLVAVLLTRMSPGFVTGDKRAIKSLISLNLPMLFGRLICLEQIFVLLTNVHSIDVLRRLVCAEPIMDKSLSNCFSCFSLEKSEADITSVLLGLCSYIEDIRLHSGHYLMAEKDLLALTS